MPRPPLQRGHGLGPLDQGHQLLLKAGAHSTAVRGKHQGGRLRLTSTQGRLADAVEGIDVAIELVLLRQHSLHKWSMFAAALQTPQQQLGVGPQR